MTISFLKKSFRDLQLFKDLQGLQDLHDFQADGRWPSVHSNGDKIQMKYENPPPTITQ